MSSAYDNLLASYHPRGAWTFDEPVGSTVVADVSGNGHDATLQSGAPTLGVAGPVLYQTAVDNNNAEWLTTLLPDNTWPALSVIVWIKGPWFGTGGNPRVVAAGHSDGDGTGFQVGFFDNLSFDVGGKGIFGVENSGTWNAAIWHMLVGTFDGSDGAAVFYDNAVEEASATWTAGNLNTASAHLGFGYNSVYNGDQWSGDMAEIAVFDTVLTAAEVLALYNAAQRVYPGWVGEGAWLS